MHTCGKPLAMVSMDNCSHNGAKLQGAIMEFVDAWKKNGQISDEEYAYLTEKVSFPWSMIDKITPRPAPEIADQLEADGLEDMHPFVTSKNTYIAPFVNAERPQYLVIENDFPNGRPALDKAGVIFTDRDTVNKVEMMKVCTCLLSLIHISLPMMDQYRKRSEYRHMTKKPISAGRSIKVYGIRSAAVGRTHASTVRIKL